MLQKSEALQPLTTTLATCTPCTLGIHSCCTGHRSACGCEVDQHADLALPPD